MKVKPVIPRSAANRDVDDAINHYLSESAAPAALGFIEALERAYAHISRHPSSWHWITSIRACVEYPQLALVATDPLPASGVLYRA
jgi:plasmid stabilization system protein ParE